MSRRMSEKRRVQMNIAFDRAADVMRQRETEAAAAHARLIAAAPALLEVAKLLDSLERTVGDDEIGFNDSLILDKALDAARAALVKVAGK